MIRSTTRLFAIAAVAGLFVALLAPAAIGAASAGNQTPVETGTPTDVTDSSATFNGNLTNLGNSTNASVSFEYWIQNDSANASEVAAGTLNATGAFDASVGDLEANTTYVVVASANASDGGSATGNEVTFATSESEDDETDSFGQRVAAHVDRLLSSDVDGPFGLVLSEWVVENNPGADNRPDHAGPSDDRGPPEHAGGADDAADDGGDGDDGTDADDANDGDEATDQSAADDGDDARSDAGQSDERGPPEHANNDNDSAGDQDGDDDDADDEDDDADDDDADDDDANETDDEDGS